jgi:hypothetical protein
MFTSLKSLISDARVYLAGELLRLVFHPGKTYCISHDLIRINGPGPGRSHTEVDQTDDLPEIVREEASSETPGIIPFIRVTSSNNCPKFLVKKAGFSRADRFSWVSP